MTMRVYTPQEAHGPMIQSYRRDMGNRDIIMMKEIDASIRVLGPHWGGFRMTYTI
jgi:methyl-accepting chemotaxis protein